MNSDPWDIVPPTISAVKPDEIEAELQEIFARVAHEVLHERAIPLAFIVIGSRAEGTARGHSDWDIAVSACAVALSTKEYLALKSAIEDAVDNFPVGIDLINFDAAPTWFLADIEYPLWLLVGNKVTFARAMGAIVAQTRFDKIAKARSNLRQALDQYSDRRKGDELPFLAVCKTVEVLVEYVWKEMKARVESEGRLAVSPKDAVRQAAVLGLIEEPEQWIAILLARNDSMHNYFGIPEADYLKLAEELFERSGSVKW